MIMPEPCGYAVLLLIANIQKTAVPCGRIKNCILQLVCRPPSGLLTSLRLLVRCLPPATTRRTGGKEEGERRKEEEGRRGRGKGRREKEVRYTGSTQPSRLSSSWWRHYRLLAICDLERHAHLYMNRDHLPSHRFDS